MTAKTLRPSFDAAIELVFENVATLGSENVPLEYACGRVPSAALSAKRSSPPYNMSAMDGYAICQTDIDRHNLCFEAGPEIFAGAQIMPEMRAGIAFPISTGARVPPGCGTVVLKERAER